MVAADVKLKAAFLARGARLPPPTPQCRLWVNRFVFTVRRRLPVYPGERTSSDPVGMSEKCRFCCKSRLQRIRPLGLSLRAAALTRWALTLFTQLQRYATHRARAGVVERPATRPAAGSEQWQQEQTHPGHLVGHAAEADRASGCASNVRTASRSSCAHAATARSHRCQRTTGQRPGHAHGCRAGSCEMVPSGSIAV